MTERVSPSGKVAARTLPSVGSALNDETLRAGDRHPDVTIERVP